MLLPSAISTFAHQTNVNRALGRPVFSHPLVHAQGAEPHQLENGEEGHHDHGAAGRAPFLDPKDLFELDGVPGLKCIHDCDHPLTHRDDLGRHLVSQVGALRSAENLPECIEKLDQTDLDLPLRLRRSLGSWASGFEDVAAENLAFAQLLCCFLEALVLEQARDQFGARIGVFVFLLTSSTPSWL